MRNNELRMYLTAERAVDQKLDSRLLDAPWFPWTITASQALDQVRTNGTEALRTLIDLVQEGEEYLQRAVEHEQRMVECCLLVQKVLDELGRYFDVCPACKGEKGAFGRERVASFGSGRGWEDCATCAGHGMLPKGASEWQDEDRTYTPAEQQLDTRIDGCTERREAA